MICSKCKEECCAYTEDGGSGWNDCGGAPVREHWENVLSDCCNEPVYRDYCPACLGYGTYDDGDMCLNCDGIGLIDLVERIEE